MRLQVGAGLEVEGGAPWDQGGFTKVCICRIGNITGCDADAGGLSGVGGWDWVRWTALAYYASALQCNMPALRIVGA